MSNATMPPYRVAITGCHRMLERTPAGHNWAAAFAAVAETEIIALHDRGAETRARATAIWDVPAYDDYATMLDREKPEIVCVATRQTMHADQVEAAVASGARPGHGPRRCRSQAPPARAKARLPLLCEKPLATSMAEADRIVDACRPSGAAFLLGLDRRWMPFYQHVRALLDDGLVGEVRVVASFGVPNLIAHGCHWLDVLADFAGDPDVGWVMGHVDRGRGDPR